LSVQLISKISNLSGPDLPTLQTDRRTDDMQSQYRALHYSASASRGKNNVFLVHVIYDIGEDDL